jgi:hypothetical protein
MLEIIVKRTRQRQFFRGMVIPKVLYRKSEIFDATPFPAFSHRKLTEEWLFGQHHHHHVHQQKRGKVLKKERFVTKWRKIFEGTSKKI